MIANIPSFFHNRSPISHNQKFTNSAFHSCPHEWVSVGGLNLEKVLRLSSGTKETVLNQNKVSESITTGVLKAGFDCFVISLNLSGKNDSSLSELSQ